MLAWEKQPEESARAYEAFCLYRNLGPDRSVSKVAQELSKSRSLISRWCAKYDWVDRIEALGARDEMIRREAIEAYLREEAEDIATREAALQKRALEIREMAADKSAKILGTKLWEQRVVRDEDGEQVTYIFMPAGWSFATAKTLYDLAFPGGTPTTEEQLEELGEGWDLDRLTSDEIETLLELDGKLHGRE